MFVDQWVKPGALAVIEAEVKLVVPSEPETESRRTHSFLIESRILLTKGE